MKIINAVLIIFLVFGSAHAGIIPQKAEENIANAYMSSSIGGLVLAGTFGYGAIGLALVESAVVLELTMMADGLTIITEDDKNLKMAKELLKNEATNFQITGEIGIVLSAGVRSLQNDMPDMSDAEAIDTLVTAINEL